MITDACIYVCVSVGVGEGEEKEVERGGERGGKGVMGSGWCKNRFSRS